MPQEVCTIHLPVRKPESINETGSGGFEKKEIGQADREARTLMVAQNPAESVNESIL